MTYWDWFWQDIYYKMCFIAIVLPFVAFILWLTQKYED